jgi:hypothetical protein
VARLSRQLARGVCWIGAVDTCAKCRVPVPRRGDEEGLGPVAAVAFAASGSKACASEQLASYRLRHDQQRHIGQQLHPGRLSALPAELALGVGQHALLAQIRVRAAVPAGHTGQSCMIPFARWPSAAGPFCVLGGVVQALQPAKSSRPKPQGSMSSPPLWPARNRT